MKYPRSIDARKRLYVGTICLLSFTGFVLFYEYTTHSKKQQSQPSQAADARLLPIEAKPAKTDRPALPPNVMNAVNLANLTAEERKDIEKKFKEKFKPAVEKWFKAYEERSPFQPEDLTFDSFQSRMGRNGRYLYTFVFEDTTLTFQDSNGNAKVFYMMTRKAAKELNELPLHDRCPRSAPEVEVCRDAGRRHDTLRRHLQLLVAAE
jgi:hypothetical protein